MNRDNTFKSSGFYAGDGDIVHVIISGESEESINLELYAASDPVNYEFSGWTNVTDYDGNVYNTVIINGQEWLVENLKVTHYADGSPITHITDTATWAADAAGAYCFYDNDSSYGTDYGALYNWFAVDNVNDLVYIERDGTQETDWRVPTRTDFSDLSTYLDDAMAATHLKEVGYTHWNWPNEGVTNKTGFTALGSGRRFQTGSFSLFMSIGFFWTSTESNATESYNAYMENSKNELFHDFDADKNAGFAVRLVRDL